MDILNNSKPLKAVLVGVQLPRVSDEETQGSLAELSRLVTTLGYQVVGQTSQKRSSTKSATVLGDGKMKELASWTGGTGVVGPMVVKKKHKAALRFEKNQEDDDFEAEEDFEDVPEESEDLSLDASSEVPREKAQVVIFDCDLSPSQLRNLESATGAQVLDRTGVIIEIFSRHARTKAARLQVEIARLTYVAPRLRETAGGEDRGGGGIGGKGAGETSIELDRRKIRDRIKELKQELSAISQEHVTRRSRRNQEISVALVGYTNAGKSSLMRALTGSEVLVADKLFATLDTTVRVLYPESRPKILISDTVGFIKKLPHDLVASFKSTLDEAANASLLLYVVDSSDPTFRSQLQVTKSVLDEVGASDVDSILVLNKVDRLSSEEREKLQQEYPEAIFLSAHNKEDVANLRLRLIKHFETAMIDEEILIPYDVQGAIGEIRAKMRVLSENYDNRGLTLTVRGHVQDIEKMRKKFGI
ncbi:GTPase HflX [Bdellovibrio bacteriovorus]|uniref:GTPase HflX n=1 Tax=Bdellovibrio bacteriovorus TaxID=959 RepID=A0A150WU38_BDEBC|nr:GTPase HflX [Bdellovibrio bacteriovorus]KYG69995.1 GTPase HflX [Bdellovibrio bacteriovorus]